MVKKLSGTTPHFDANGAPLERRPAACHARESDRCGVGGDLTGAAVPLGGMYDAGGDGGDGAAAPPVRLERARRGRSDGPSRRGGTRRPAAGSSEPNRRLGGHHGRAGRLPHARSHRCREARPRCTPPAQAPTAGRRSIRGTASGRESSQSIALLMISTPRTADQRAGTGGTAGARAAEPLAERGADHAAPARQMMMSAAWRASRRGDRDADDRNAQTATTSAIATIEGTISSSIPKPRPKLIPDRDAASSSAPAVRRGANPATTHATSSRKSR